MDTSGWWSDSRRTAANVVFGFTTAGGRIVDIGLFADPARLGRLDLTILDH